MYQMYLYIFILLWYHVFLQHTFDKNLYCSRIYFIHIIYGYYLWYYLGSQFYKLSSLIQTCNMHDHWWQKSVCKCMEGRSHYSKRSSCIYSMKNVCPSSIPPFSRIKCTTSTPQIHFASQNSRWAAGDLDWYSRCMTRHPPFEPP